MCQTHAKRIDDDEATYTTEMLHRWKLESEAWAATQIGVPWELPARVSDSENRIQAFELELNRLVSHRVRDALTAMRYPMTIFVSRNAPSGRADDMSALLAASDRPEIDGHELVELVSVFCDPSMRAATIGPPLAPDGVRWFDWVVSGVLDCVTRCESALATYGARADPELVVGLEELMRRCRSMATILLQIERNQGDDIFGSVGRSYWTLLFQTMLHGEAVWRGWLQNVYVRTRAR